MKLKIISDGTSCGTKLIDEDTGKAVGLVQSIDWSVNAGAPFADCVIKISTLPVELDVSNVKIEYDLVVKQ